MITKLEEAGYLSELVKVIWPEHTLDELAEIISSYMNSESSAVFAEIVNGQYVGVALCCLRHDYVEGCKTSPVGYLEGISIHEEYRHQGIGTMVVSECEQWAEEMFYTKTVVESRDNKVDFYTKMGYEICGEAVEGDTFRVIRMEKEL